MKNINHQVSPPLVLVEFWQLLVEICQVKIVLYIFVVDFHEELISFQMAEPLYPCYLVRVCAAGNRGKLGAWPHSESR